MLGLAQSAASVVGGLALATDELLNERSSTLRNGRSRRTSEGTDASSTVVHALSSRSSLHELLPSCCSPASIAQRRSHIPVSVQITPGPLDYAL